MGQSTPITPAVVGGTESSVFKKAVKIGRKAFGNGSDGGEKKETKGGGSEAMRDFFAKVGNPTNFSLIERTRRGSMAEV